MGAQKGGSGKDVGRGGEEQERKGLVKSKMEKETGCALCGNEHQPCKPITLLPPSTRQAYFPPLVLPSATWEGRVVYMIALEDSRGLRGPGKTACQEGEGRVGHFRRKATERDVWAGGAGQEMALFFSEVPLLAQIRSFDK